ncbi:MAG: class I SAM-dependent methyltransferase [Sedimentisphaerales bacterium]|nr:class I SAM-dependent methyltransferase [Sedimentisphaerales bacterium]
MTNSDNVERWMDKQGEEFLKKAGIAKGQTILDFGSGAGHYAIPASKVVGDNGKVYALDKNGKVLDELRRIIKNKGINNIELINRESVIPLIEGLLDAVLCYDVMHYERKSQRKVIYREIHRVLKRDGLFSLYPKHHKRDYPLDNLADMELEDIIDEIKESRFVFKEKRLEKILHDNYMNEGVILIFRKGRSN